jgi:phosphinothricin acetyltransferase
MTAADWPAVARIYAAGIAGGDATFEQAVPSREEFLNARVSSPRLVAREEAGQVVGWAALSPTSTRPVYRGVAEVSIYVDPAFARRGVGRALLSALVDESERAGFWTLQAGVFPENVASIALHESCGFERVGVSRRVGRMADGRWRDVVSYERRSEVVGPDLLPEGTGGERTRTSQGVARAERRRAGDTPAEPLAIGGYATRFTRAALPALAAIAAIVFVSWPLLFTASGMGQDWSVHLWVLWRDSLSISHEGHPGLFLNSSESAFYPLYAFYGGTVYALAGTLAVLLGNAPVAAYVITWMIGLAAAYGGWYWLGRMAGLGRWAAQVPSFLFITSGYYITDIYAHGDWMEVLAVSAIPLLLASGLSVLRANSLKILPALALAGSTLVFFGGHNLTLLWASTLFGLLAAAILIAIPAARAMITRAGVIRVLAVAVPAALVNAWYLLPDIAYAGRTSIANVFPYEREIRLFNYVLSAHNLFTPFHFVSVLELPDVVYALPVFAIIWVLVGVAISVGQSGGGAWRRVLWIFSGLAVLVGVLMTHPGLILDLPRPYTFLQGSQRLEIYVLLGLAGAALAVLVLARDWPRRLRLGCWTGAGIALIASAATAVWQVDGYPLGGSTLKLNPDRYTVFTAGEQPPLLAGAALGCLPGIGCSYMDNTLPLMEPPPAAAVEFPSARISKDRETIHSDLPPGALVDSNLAGAPYFVKISGAKAVARDPNGHMILRLGLTNHAPVITGTGAIKFPGGEVVSLSPANTFPVVLGRVVTVAALIALVLVLVTAAVRGRRRPV